MPTSLDRLLSLLAVLAFAAAACTLAAHCCFEAADGDRAVYLSGQEAFEAGRAEADCPHPHDWATLRRRSLWLRGYDDARRHSRHRR